MSNERGTVMNHAEGCLCSVCCFLTGQREPARTVLYTVPRATVGPLTLDRLEELDLEGTGRPAADEPDDVGHWVARGLIS